MFGDDVDPRQKFLQQAEAEDCSTGNRARERECAEEMHRSRGVAQQKADGQDIEHHAEGAAESVMRDATAAGWILNGDLGYTGTVNTCQCRDEAMKLSVEVDVFENLGSVGLEGGAEIVEVHSGGLRHQPVRDTGWQAAGESVIGTLVAPAAGNVVAFVDWPKQRGDVFRGVLKVAIHGNDDVALGFVKAGGESGGLAEVAAEADNLEAMVGLDEIGEKLVAAVGGGVVDEKDFVGAVDGGEDSGQAVVERQDGVLFVVNGDDEGKHRVSSYSSVENERLPYRATEAGARWSGMDRLPVCVLLENVRSLYNVGSFFRTGDAVSLEMLYLGGITGFPPQKMISKTALGAEDSLPWERAVDPAGCVAGLRVRGYEIAAIETSVHAVDLFDWQPAFPVCVLFGHETDGLTPELGAQADTHVRIPMLGRKHSLNVATAGGVVLYELLRKYRARFS